MSSFKELGKPPEAKLEDVRRIEISYKLIKIHNNIINFSVCRTCPKNKLQTTSEVKAASKRKPNH